MTTIRARVLCENSVQGQVGAIAEHGWSVWLETPAGPYLFDTGQGKALLNNAAFFRTPLAEVRGVLISHHHVDHTGGLLNALNAIQPADGVPIYAHPDLFKDSWSVHDEQRRHIGVPFSGAALESVGARFDLVAGWRELAPGLYLTGEIPRRHAFEIGDQNLFHYDAEGQFVVDPIRDDQTVVLDTDDGLFVLLGCSHSGLINILDYIVEQTGQSRFHTIIGGTHLGPVEQQQVDQTIAALHRYDIGRLGVSHCTGQPVAARLAAEFGERFFFCSVGTLVEL
jgi:7,8-dihydropterin-6-yl-methyl-4-(beta-D-ribofuranosyl)aminobenzene 5'-phosphate synthase